jgi:hypothetical protein
VREGTGNRRRALPRRRSGQAGISRKALILFGSGGFVIAMMKLPMKFIFAATQGTR